MSQPTNPVSAVELPAGGQLLGFPNLKSQSSKCTADTSLQTQLAPLIASMYSQFKMLNLLKPLIDVILGLPQPPVQALQEFAQAAADLAPYLQVSTPAGVLPFLRDLLCLEIRSLNCLLGNLKSITTLTGAEPGVTVALDARNVLDSYPPIVGILNLASGLFQMAGLTVPKAPQLGGGTDRSSLMADRNAVAAFTASLQAAADALGGCH